MAKKYLIRTNISPFDNPSYYEAIRKNIVRSNSGNLLFPYSIARTLMTDDNTEFIPVNTHNPFSDEEVDRINNEYDAFLIPLANAFRVSFLKELLNITSLVKRLRIPCIVIGVGYQGGVSKDVSKGLAWRETVVDFCRAILDKSAMIGVRGRVTADYLDKLGFTEGRDYTVIGCPSMFLYGDRLPEPKPLKLYSDIRIHINSKVDLPQKFHNYLVNVCKLIPDHYYLPQNQYELCAMYLGLPLGMFRADLKEFPDGYPADPSSAIYTNNRVRGFINVPSWFNFLKEGDLNFGSRIHGNIAAVLAGIPAFIVAPDSRVLELADYHNIPHTTIDKLDNNISIFELLSDVDFSRIMTGHAERFAAYQSFLEKNDLKTVYSDSFKASPDQVLPFDKRLSKCSYNKPLVPYAHLHGSDKLSAVRYRNTFLAKRTIKKLLQPIIPV